MPYASTYGKKAYGYQAEELSPEEQAGVPMLTNIPTSAEEAAGRGQDVYFLSDRPETEQFLAEKTPERPYKRVLRDVRSVRPSEEDLTGMEAWNDFKNNYLSKQAGFYDPDDINPATQAQKAREDYVAGFFRGKSRGEIDAMDPKTVTNIYKEADRLAKAEETKATWTRRNGLEIKNRFLADWKEKRKEIEAAKTNKEPLVPVMEGDKVVYRRRTEAVGAQAPISQLVPVQDEEGNITYQPRTQAVGKTPPPKAGGIGKKVSYVGWDKSGKETVERVDVDDTDSQSDLIGKGYVEKSKFDRMDMVDRKLAQREAMKRIGGGIPLDRVTAAKFLKEAGGDKEKARKLAREKGYTF